MNPEGLLRHLQNLEVELHQESVRSDSARLEKLLHESFREIGSSGRTYSRSEIIDHLLSERGSASVWSQDFCMDLLADDVAILRYRSARVDDDCKMFGYALRSSIWVHSEGEWRIRFHQGTSTEPFGANVT